MHTDRKYAVGVDEDETKIMLVGFLKGAPKHKKFIVVVIDYTGINKDTGKVTTENEMRLERQ